MPLDLLIEDLITSLLLRPSPSLDKSSVAERETGAAEGLLWNVFGLLRVLWKRDLVGFTANHKALYTRAQETGVCEAVSG